MDLGYVANVCWGLTVLRHEWRGASAWWTMQLIAGVWSTTNKAGHWHWQSSGKGRESFVGNCHIIWEEVKAATADRTREAADRGAAPALIKDWEDTTANKSTKKGQATLDKVGVTGDRQTVRGGGRVCVDDKRKVRSMEGATGATGGQRVRGGTIGATWEQRRATPRHQRGDTAG